jgi:uncharacterized membrane protein YhaH (DUF805 family)
MNVDSLFVNPKGRTPRAQFVPALLVLLAAVLFYAFVVRGRTAQFCLLTLLYPALMLHARRLHDMGHTGWMLAVPAVLLVAMFGVRLDYVSFGAGADDVLTWLALAVAAAFARWCTVARGGGTARAAPATPH